MTVLEVDTTVGNIKVEFDIDKKYCNPAGDVQGGIVSGMVDDATALAFIFQNHFKKTANNRTENKFFVSN